MPPVPPPRQVFYAYAIVDVRETPPTPLGLELSRSDARTKVEWHADADHLRIRRARVTLYPS